MTLWLAVPASTQEIPSAPGPPPPISRVPDLRVVEPLPRFVTVGDLRDPAQLRRFEAEARQVCALRSAPVTSEFGPGDAARGTIIGQRPEPGTRLSCERLAVTVIRSEGPSPTRPADDVVRSTEPARAVTVPRFATREDALAFAVQARIACRGPVAIDVAQTEHDAPAGRVIRQDPPGGTRLSCTDPPPRVSVLVSDGPRTPPPPPQPDFPVGDLARPEARTALERRATAACETPFAIRIVEEEGPLVAGSFLGQDPAPPTRFRCGMPVTVRLSAGPPAPPPPPPPPEPRPEPPPPEPQPEQRPEPPPVLPRPVPQPQPPPPPPVIEPLPDPAPDPAIADGPSPQPDRDIGPPDTLPGIDSSEPRPTEPPDRIPWGWIVAGGLLLAVLAVLAGRGLRGSPPRAGPAPAIRQGVPTASAEPGPGLVLAGPRLALRWHRGRPGADIMTEPAILAIETDHG